MGGVLSELFGYTEGQTKGKGGSMHFYNKVSAPRACCLHLPPPPDSVELLIAAVSRCRPATDTDCSLPAVPTRT